VVERWRRTLCESFVGAIAVGWLYAQGLLHFAYGFVTPVFFWLSRRGAMQGMSADTRFHFEDAVPDFGRSAALLVLASLLFRWLYLKPSARAPDAELRNL